MGNLDINGERTNGQSLSKRARSVLKRMPGLRSSWYFSAFIYELLSHRPSHARAGFDALFTRSADPWQFHRPMEQTRFLRELTMITDVHGPSHIRRTIEIGCAEGIFTEILASHCESLLALDLSPVALSRARQRCARLSHVRFAEFDVRYEAVPGTFDLVVASCVLEYIAWPATMRRVRSRLVSSIAPGGLLLVSSTTGNDVLDHAWWARVLVRGKWINHFFATHPALEIVAEEETARHVDTLFRKRR
jgi:trans-aconitate methyltransferase